MNNYEDGVLVDHAGAWEYGEDGAEDEDGDESSEDADEDGDDAEEATENDGDDDDRIPSDGLVQRLMIRCQPVVSPN